MLIRAASIFERMDQSEMDAMFDQEGDQAKVKSWIKEGITWRLGDASAPELIEELGTQDVVVANRFLCHMQPAAAESCLRNLARLVKPGGYLFVSGVDLDVRTKVAKEMGWQPVSDLIREIHEGDLSLATGWPLGWWGLEPFSQHEPDWMIRYASVFQVGETPLFNPDGTTAPLDWITQCEAPAQEAERGFQGVKHGAVALPPRGSSFVPAQKKRGRCFGRFAHREFRTHQDLAQPALAPFADAFE